MAYAPKIHGIPITLWRRAKAAAAEAGIPVSRYVINALQAAVERGENEAPK
jgi:hypothetical protein